VEAIYSSINNQVGKSYKWWQDEDLIADLDRRYADLKSGKDKGMSLEQATEHLLNRLK